MAIQRMGRRNVRFVWEARSKLPRHDCSRPNMASLLFCATSTLAFMPLPRSPVGAQPLSARYRTHCHPLPEGTKNLLDALPERVISHQRMATSSKSAEKGCGG